MMDKIIDFDNITINNNNLVSEDGPFRADSTFSNTFNGLYSENVTNGDEESESDTFVESKSKFEREQEESSHASFEPLVKLSYVKSYIDEQNTTASIEMENTKNISKSTQQQKKLIQNSNVNRKCSRENEYESLRPFCSFCPKSFLSLKNLQTHELLHTKHYPFKYSLHLDKFHQLSNLNHTLLKHTDESFNAQKITTSKKDSSIKKLKSEDINEIFQQLETVTKIKLTNLSSRPKEFQHDNKEKKSNEISHVPEYFEFMNSSQQHPQLIQNVGLQNSQYTKLIDCEPIISNLKNLDNKNYSSNEHLELDDSGFDNLNLKEYEYERSELQYLMSESSGQTVNESLLETTESQTKSKCTPESDYSILRQLNQDPTYDTNEKKLLLSDAGLKAGEDKSVKAKDRPFKCSYCPKDFTKKFHLLTHERIHTGYFPYGCSLCLKKFRQLSNLNKHMLHHTLESLKCSICFKQLNSKKELKKHVDSHKNEKLFSCSVCNKKYKYHWSLSFHGKTHELASKFNYKCKFCHRNFYSKQTLKKHHRLNCNAENFCINCNKTFVHLSNLKKHITKCRCFR